MTIVRPTIAIVVGTRPEAIKLAPVWRALESRAVTQNVIVSTGQHADLLDQTMAALELVATHSMSVMTPGQDPSSVLARVIDECTKVFKVVKPSAVVVQGDTSSVLGAAIAAFHLRVPVAHVEAGLRTYDLNHPFPEEANRQLVDRISQWCFAPTLVAADNLRRENVVEDRIIVTGNTAVDTLLWMANRVPAFESDQYVLVTLHRRESFGQRLRDILKGVRDFLEDVPIARAIWPVHPNPNVREAAEDVLGDHERVTLYPPADYASFVGFLKGARVILTDSGGVQEEAPSLGKAVLIARETTERGEALQGGRNSLIGRQRGAVRAALNRAWTAPAYSGVLPAPNPFGDGTAGVRIAATLAAQLSV